MKVLVSWVLNMESERCSIHSQVHVRKTNKVAMDGLWSKAMDVQTRTS